MLKSSGTLLTDDAGQTTVLDDVLFVKVEQVDGDRVRVASTTGKKQGWLRADQLVSAEGAMDYFNQAIAKDVRNADAYWRRGCLWSTRFDHDHALADFDAAIRIAPEQPRFYVDRSTVLVSKRSRSIERLPTVTRRSSSIPRWREHICAAITWVWKQDPQRAEADYDEAVKLDPTEWIYWGYRASILDQQREPR